MIGDLYYPDQLHAPIELTWRQVFDSYAKPGRWRHMDECAAYAYNGGYMYFNWNGRIYTVTGTDTGLLTEDVT